MKFDKRLLQLPNLLSISRLLFLPLLFLLLWNNFTISFVIIFTIIGSTDYFDGIAARYLGQSSELGKTIDSVADLGFYLSSGYFYYYLFPDYLAPSIPYLAVMFLLMIFSFTASIIKFGKPYLMHTYVLRLNAILVFLLIILSFWFNTTYFTIGIIFLYYIGFIEEILIFQLYGKVERDTPSLITLILRTNSK